MMYFVVGALVWGYAWNSPRRHFPFSVLVFIGWPGTPGPPTSTSLVVSAVGFIYTGSFDLALVDLQ